MQLSTLIASVTLMLTMLTPLVIHAAPPVQPPRWVLADDLRVHIGPSTEDRVIGMLSRGAELILKAATVATFA